MKKFFNENEDYGDAALAFENEVYDALIPIMEKFVKNGYSTRDIQSILINFAVEQTAILRLNAERADSDVE